LHSNKIWTEAQAASFKHSNQYDSYETTHITTTKSHTYTHTVKTMQLYTTKCCYFTIKAARSGNKLRDCNVLSHYFSNMGPNLQKKILEKILSLA